MAVRRLAEIQPDSFEFTPENQAWVDKQIAKYPRRPAGLGRDGAAAPRAGAERRLGAEAGHREDRRDPRHAGHPGAGDRDLLLDVQPEAGREVLHPDVRHDALRAARLGRHQGRAGAADRPAGSRDGRRAVLLARGRVPRRLLQRADGADQRRLLRGPDAGELRQAARRPRGRTAGEAGLADGPADLGAGRRPDDPDELYGADGRGGSYGRRERSASQPADGWQLPTDQDNAPTRRRTVGSTSRATTRRQAAGLDRRHRHAHRRPVGETRPSRPR